MFQVLKEDGQARLGLLKTKHGAVETPSYVVVGTNGRIRCVEPEDIKPSGTQMVISNTYHLWQSLGEEGLNAFPGLHEFMEWDGPIMTDSGGFQVFSMGYARELGSGKIAKGDNSGEEMKDKNLVRITDSGVYFTDKSGGEIYLDAELSMKIQEQLGSDIVLAFDEPSSPLHDYDYTQKAMERTHAWATRSLDAKTSKQIIYGIVQGGAFENLRRESAKTIGAMPFDGFAIGGAFGSSFGSQKNDTFIELEWVNQFLPKAKPRHLLGIGRIDDIFEAVERGVDTMDCVIPTREGRHGSIWSNSGRFDVVKGKYMHDESPLVIDCSCPICNEKKITKKDIYQFFKDRDPRAPRYASIHNIYFFNNLLGQIREAIKFDEFKNFKKSYLTSLAEKKKRIE
ncbi:MAG: tRNA guanosine(34) transglycosylase Tgt [Patescibacteria group bacterium]